MGRVIVAFSGGTDSAYLAWAAAPRAGAERPRRDRRFGFLPRIAQARCRSLRARSFGIAHEYIETREFDNPDYAPQRSRPLLPLQGRAVHAAGGGGPRARLRAHRLRRERGRPGRLPPRPERRQPASRGRAAGRCRPDARPRSASSRARPACPPGTVPASACLSSRIPYGTPVTIENVKTVEAGEEAVEGSRLPPVPRALPRRGGAHRNRPRRDAEGADAGNGRAASRQSSSELGFQYVTLDLEGYRQGSLNEVLRLKK